MKFDKVLALKGVFDIQGGFRAVEQGETGGVWQTWVLRENVTKQFELFALGRHGTRKYKLGNRG